MDDIKNPTSMIINQEELDFGAPQERETRSYLWSDIDPARADNIGLKAEDVTLWDAFKAGSRFWGGAFTEGAFNEVKRLTYTQQKGYNPFEDEQVKLFDKTIAAKYAGYLANSSNPDETRNILQDIQDYERSAQIAELDVKGLDNQAYLVGALAGAFLNPLNIIPATTVLKGVSKGLKLATAAGAGTVSGAVTAGLYNVGSQSVAPTDASEKNTTLMLGALMGAALGTGIGYVGGYINSQGSNKVLQPLTDDITENLNKITLPDESTVGARAWIDRSKYVNQPLEVLKQEGGAKNWIVGKMFDAAYWTSSIFSKSNEVLRNSKSRAAQLATLNLTGSALRFKNVTQGERLVNIYQKAHVDQFNDSNLLFDAMNDTYVQYKQKAGKEFISKEAFAEKINNHIRYGDKLDIPGAEKVVKAHKDIVNRYLKELKNLRLLPRDYIPDPKRTYIHVEYNIDAIKADPKGAKKAFGLAMKDATEDLKLRLEAEIVNSDIPDERAMLEAEVLEVKRALNMSDEEWAEYNGTETIANITGGNSLDNFSTTRFQSKALKERKLFINQTLVRNFIKNDSYEQVMQQAIEQHVKTKHMVERFGDVNLTEVNRQITEDYDTLRGKLKESLDAKKITQKKYDKELQKLIKQEEVDRTQLLEMKNRYFGVRADGYKKFTLLDKIADTATAITQAKLGQGMALAQLPDLAPMITRLSSTEYARNLTELAQEFGATIKTVDKNVLRQMGFMLDNMDWRSQRMFEATENNLASKNAYGRKLIKAKQLIYKTQLLKFVQDTWQQVGIPIVTNDILAASNRLVKGKLTAKDKALFERLGVSDNMAKQFTEQALLHTQTLEDGTKFINPLAWKPDVRTNFMAAAREYQTAHMAIEPNIGTKPAWFDTTYGRIFGQYKGFTLRALESYTLRDLQDGDLEALTRFVLRGILGSMSYVIRSGSYGRVSENDYSPQRLVYEGLMRGGGLAGIDMIAQIGHTIRQQTGLPTSLAEALGVRDERMFARSMDDPIAQQIYGATGIVLKDVSRAIRNVRNGKMSYEDWQYVEKYIPVYGAFYTQSVLNQLR